MKSEGMFITTQVQRHENCPLPDCETALRHVGCVLVRLVAIENIVWNLTNGPNFACFFLGLEVNGFHISVELKFLRQNSLIILPLTLTINGFT